MHASIHSPLKNATSPVLIWYKLFSHLFSSFQRNEIRSFQFSCTPNYGRCSVYIIWGVEKTARKTLNDLALWFLSSGYNGQFTRMRSEPEAIETDPVFIHYAVEIAEKTASRHIHSANLAKLNVLTMTSCWKHAQLSFYIKRNFFYQSNNNMFLAISNDSLYPIYSNSFFANDLQRFFYSEKNHLPFIYLWCIHYSP